MLSFYEGVGVGLLKIEESESELLCTDSVTMEKPQLYVNDISYIW
jgi:hypothetical protein